VLQEGTCRAEACDRLGMNTVVLEPCNSRHGRPLNQSGTCIAHATAGSWHRPNRLPRCRHLPAACLLRGHSNAQPRRACALTGPDALVGECDISCMSNHAWRLLQALPSSGFPAGLRRAPQSIDAMRDGASISAILSAHSGCLVARMSPSVARAGHREHAACSGK
jgi:hypothetical protein